jgi:hypothetical protein
MRLRIKADRIKSAPSRKRQKKNAPPNPTLSAEKARMKGKTKEPTPPPVEMNPTEAPVL